MRAHGLSATGLLITTLLASAVYVGCTAPASNPAPAATAGAPAEIGGQEEFGPYEPVANWPQPLEDAADGVKHVGWTWGSVGAVYAETPDRIWIVQRGELPLPEGAKPWTHYTGLQPPRQATGNGDGLSATCMDVPKRGWERRYHHSVLVMNREGKMIDWWQDVDKMFEGKCGRGAHKVKISPYDPEKHVWIIDDQLHVIYKFTQDGKLVLTLGTKGERGREAGKLFDRPTDIDWLPDGTFFISDGYGGKRVAKFDKDGNFLVDWGAAPADPANPGPNEWNTVHSIGITKDRRITVVDRGHRRIQVFDENGKFLYMFPTGVASSPYAHMISAADQSLWQVDGGTNRVVKYDLDGHYLYGWGGPGGGRGQLSGGHSLSVDQENNLYIAEVFGGRVQKFRPKPGADPAKVMGPELKVGTPASSN